MPRFVVLMKEGDNEERLWRHIDAIEAEDAAEAIEGLAAARGSGVAVAIPFEDWQLFQVEATVRVSPVIRARPTEVEPEVDLGLGDDQFYGPSDREIEEDLEGLRQGPRG